MTQADVYPSEDVTLHRTCSPHLGNSRLGKATVLLQPETGIQRSPNSAMLEAIAPAPNKHWRQHG